MQYHIVTNNGQVAEYYNSHCQVTLLDGGYGDVLYYVRDQIHKGGVLATHPLSGSVKPNETVYKSVALYEGPSDGLSWSSLDLIEKSIMTYEGFKDSGRLARDRKSVV